MKTLSMPCFLIFFVCLLDCCYYLPLVSAGIGSAQQPSVSSSLCVPACPALTNPTLNLVTLYSQESQRIKWINTWNLSEWRTFGGFTIGRHIKGVYEVIFVLIWEDQYTLPLCLSVELTIPHQLVILLTQRRHKERRGRGRIVGNRTVLIIFGAYFHLEVLSSGRNI